MNSEITVRVLDEIGDRRTHVKVILPNGQIDAVPKASLSLPVIDTKDYEKLDAMA